MFMSDWGALMDPPEGRPGQDAYTFVIRINVFHLSYNFLCQVLILVSISAVAAHVCNTRRAGGGGGREDFLC
jgi:hypothetical protein